MTPFKWGAGGGSTNYTHGTNLVDGCLVRQRTLSMCMLNCDMCVCLFENLRLVHHERRTMKELGSLQ